MNVPSKDESIKKQQSHLLLVQDISGVGRCSSLAALPVLSVAGIHCSLWPTMLLSTHTGGFGAVYKRNLLADMEGMLSHWLRLGLRFDMIYVGYVGSAEVLSLVEAALPDLLSFGGRLFVDPVMGDKGKPYAFCGEDLIDGFRRLASKADLIFPNRTEAAMLLGQALMPGVEPEMPDPEALLAMGSKGLVITGARQENGIGVLAQQAGKAAFATYRPWFEGSFPGTGDLLASAIIAAQSRGAGLPAACDLACDFLDQSLQKTVVFGAPSRFGLAFETALPAFCRALEQQSPN